MFNLSDLYKNNNVKLNSISENMLYKNNYDFNTFLDKYNIYTNFNNIDDTDFEDLYKYIYNRFGDHNVYYLSSLVFDVILHFTRIY